MLTTLRTDAWQGRARWSRVLGLILLLVVLFVPLSFPFLLLLAIVGLALFLFGATAWLVRTDEPWLRRGGSR